VIAREKRRRLRWDLRDGLGPELAGTALRSDSLAIPRHPALKYVPMGSQQSFDEALFAEVLKEDCDWYCWGWREPIHCTRLLPSSEHQEPVR